MNERKGSSSKILIFLVLLTFVLIGVLKLDYDRSLKKSSSESSEKVVIEVTEGESVDNILKSLIDNELIQKKYLYYTKLYLKINNLGSKLQAGTYELPKNLSIIELIDTLQFGRSQDVWVSIPEGLRKDEIADIVATELGRYNTSSFYQSDFLSLTTDSSFISTLDLPIQITDLEGFLFPDKYALPKDANTEFVLRMLVDNFKRKVGENYTYQDIILASIVEREGFNGNDRPIIAGIIIKRFNEGWLLQTDATLLYPVKDWKHAITVVDKEDDNPYNTYKRIGLPPTPICNPGLQSIEAVWNPTETNYYYYIHDKDRNPHYGATLSEHNANVNKYLR
jgi:UPF0755 protein